jgi:hypothetical protein
MAKHHDKAADHEEYGNTGFGTCKGYSLVVNRIIGLIDERQYRVRGDDQQSGDRSKIL